MVVDERFVSKIVLNESQLAMPNKGEPRRVRMGFSESSVINKSVP